jgi:CxxC motif-containing protein (DUF1111 family)
MRKLVIASTALVFASATLAGGGDLSRAIGKALFERAWVPAPSSTLANDGLGPVFNARACSACHQKLDRALPLADGKGGFSHQGMVLKLSDKEGRPDPIYGAQLQTAAVSGFMPEGTLVMTDAGVAADALGAGPISSQTRTGLRAAPALRGIGRFADVPDDAILALADPEDRDGDGISGRANWIIDKQGERRLGRFGLKASGATLTEQIETAFSMDLGMSTGGRTSLAGDCLTETCRAGPHGGTADDPEIRHDLVAMLADYLASIPPPQPVGNEAGGARLFAAAGCASCHTPSLPGAKGEVRAHTDLLLHDLGAELDGGATEPGVATTEWRTAPLWGLSRALASKAGLLHDGRASGIGEAVALHGGEGAGARARFGKLSREDRAALLRYVEGL